MNSYKNKWMTRCIGLLVYSCIMLSLMMSFTAPAFAGAGSEDGLYRAVGLQTVEMPAYGSGGVYLPDAPLTGEGLVRQTIINALEARESSINLSGTGMPMKDMIDVYWYVLHNEPQFFYVAPNISYSSTVIYPVYTADAATINAQKLELKSALDTALAAIPRGLSEAETVLAANNYLCYSSEYDNALQKRSVYDILVQGTAVCEGYARAMIYILREFGIESIFVGSDAMTHAWNLVKVDGSWYHVDATWNDPVRDTLGRVAHDNLLLSDSAIRATKHTSWNSGYPSATSTLYDNAWWRGINSNMYYINDEWFYTDGNGLQHNIKAYNPVSGMTRTVYTFSGTWKASLEGHYWTGTRMLLGWYGGYLIYNTQDSFYRIKPNGTGNTLIYKDSSLSGLNAVYGMNVLGKTLKYQLADSPNNVPYNTKTLDLSSYITAVYEQSITINSMPKKTFYLKNQPFSSNGMSVTVTYSDGSSKSMTVQSAWISGYNPAVLGKQTLTVTVGAAQRSFTVDVFDGRKGDATGEGSIDVGDIVDVRDHILGKKILTAASLAGGDVDLDGELSVVDIVDIRDHILGKAPFAA